MYELPGWSSIISLPWSAALLCNLPIHSWVGLWLFHFSLQYCSHNTVLLWCGIFSLIQKIVLLDSVFFFLFIYESFWVTSPPYLAISWLLDHFLHQLTYMFLFQECLWLPFWSSVTLYTWPRHSVEWRLFLGWSTQSLSQWLTQAGCIGCGSGFHICILYCHQHCCCCLDDHLADYFLNALRSC